MFDRLAILADILQVANYEQNLKQSEDFEKIKGTLDEVKSMLVDITMKVDNLK